MAVAGTSETARQLGDLMKKYSLPAGTNKAALKRVMDRLGANSEREDQVFVPTTNMGKERERQPAKREIDESLERTSYINTTCNGVSESSKSGKLSGSSSSRSNSRNASPNKYKRLSTLSTDAEAVIATAKSVENVLLGIPSSREFLNTLYEK